MLEIILAFSWVIIGLMTAGYMLYEHHQQGEDIAVSDILGATAIASTGPIPIALIGCVMLSNKLEGITDRVLIKGRKRC